MTITSIETIRAVSDLITSLFDEPPTTKDISEGFTRPCSYVQLAGSSSAREGALRHDTFAVEIIRFGARTDRGWIELLHYREALASALLSPLPVGDGACLFPDDIDFILRRDEMVLITSFTVDLYQELPPEDADAVLMETLTIRKED